MSSSTSYDVVLALARQLAPADQERLAAALSDAPAAPQQNLTDAPATLPALAPEVQRLVAGMTIDDFVVPPSSTPEDAIALLRSWAEEDADAGEDEGESWDDVLRSLDANRFSTRRLFPDLDHE